MEAPPGRAVATLRQCATAGPFFTVSTDEPGPGWQPATALLEPTAELRNAIDQVRRWAGEPEPRVAASLFLLSYCGRLLSTAVAGILLDRVLLDLRAHRVHWRYRPGVGVQLSVPRPAGWLADSDQVLVTELGRRLLDIDLAAMIAAVRATVPVADKLLWGNVASSLAGALSGLAAVGAVPADRCRRTADALLDLPSLQGTGHFTGPGLTFIRRSCCLYYRLPAAAGAMCGDCPLPRP